MANPKQAVLLIHGVGEQRPMDTLRGFVKTAWTLDHEVQHRYAHPDVYSKPDDLCGSLELRRLTTTKNKEDIRTDFFEYYWAHLMEGTTVGHVWAWYRTLIARNPFSLPQKLQALWIILVTILVLVLFFTMQLTLPAQFVWIPRWLSAVLSILTVAVAPAVKLIIGDAARYLHPSPTNINQRQEIREKGVDLLLQLHQSGRYDRIIVVGHSLGTVIGYDILTHAWARLNQEEEPRKPYAGLDELEDMLKHDLPDKLNPEDFQQAQRHLQEGLREQEHPWLVTDFLTMGSPLTHADVLLAQNHADLIKKQDERELPTCPPVQERELISYPADHQKRMLHYAALFGPTRWTNLYFPSHFLIDGDFVSGPLAPVFGPGIRDIPVKTRQNLGLFSHTLYWDYDSKTPVVPSHIQTLRKALKLVDESDIDE